jgi:multiple sugar transport system substrate-binding protein
MASNEFGKAKATLPQSSEMTDILVRELSSALAGEKSPKEALDASAKEISALLGSCAPMSYPAQ